MDVPNWKQKLAAELKRDKKKTVMLTVLLIVGGIVCGRFIVSQITPSKAGAAIDSTRTSAAPSPAPAAATRRGGIKDPAKWAEYIRQIDTDIERDLFRPNSAFFPPLEKPKPNRIVIEEASREALRKAEIQAVRAQAQALVLQSTIVSATPTAIINSRVLRAGEVFNDFKIIEIGARSCTLEKNDIKIILEMRN